MYSVFAEFIYDLLELQILICVTELIQSIPSDWMTHVMTLGEGESGIVTEEILRVPGRPEMRVAVKTLNATYMSTIEENKEQFLKEAKIMMELEHEHIVRLIGFCFEPRKYMMVGDRR